MVKGGHCIDITYYDPKENITTFYEEDQSYCHKRSCAKKTFRIGFNEVIWSISYGSYDMIHITWFISHDSYSMVFMNPCKYERLCSIRWFHFGSLEKKIWKQKSKYHHHWRFDHIVVALYETTGAKESSPKFKFRHKAFATKSISLSWNLWLATRIYGNILHAWRL